MRLHLNRSDPAQPKMAASVANSCIEAQLLGSTFGWPLVLVLTALIGASFLIQLLLPIPQLQLLYLVPACFGAWRLQLRPAGAIVGLAAVVPVLGLAVADALTTWTALAGTLFSSVAVLAGAAFSRKIGLRLAHETVAARTDPLTGALNGRGFGPVLREELSLARGEARQIALVYVDLDHFKAVNDRYGHDAGDALLQQFVAELKSELLSEGDIARLGGDEFVILLREAAGDETIQAFEQRLMRVLRKLEHRITASAGGLVVRPGSALNGKELIALSDELMYRIKRSGKAGLLFETIGTESSLAKAA